MTDVVQVSDKGRVRTIALTGHGKAFCAGLFASEDAAEARRAFFDKRAPVFTGR